MVKSIRTPLLFLVCLSIVLVSVFSMMIALKEHESLYKVSVTRDLVSLSENLANDFLPLLATNALEFELTTILLRLDSYENIVFAKIFDDEAQLITAYRGAAFNKTSFDQWASIDTQGRFPNVTAVDGQVIATRIIGDKRLPQGYLLIVNDLSGALANSKREFLQNSLPLALVIIFISLSVSFYLVNSMTRPITQLSEFVSSVSKSKDYSLRPPSFPKYEAARLSSNVAFMMDTIDAELEKNKTYTEQLLDQQQSMEKMANYDALTNLPNRHFILDTINRELAHAKDNEQDLALMFFDLDGFKEVNDSFGHEVGDKLLIEVAKRVQGFLREGDLVSRLGGDEFLMLLHDQPEEQALSNIAIRLIHGLSQTFFVEGWSLKIGASIGIATASQSSYELNQFISNADLAMYSSKVAGKGRFTFFADSMSVQNKRKLLVANAIDDALKNNEFSMFYQAKVDKQHQVKGYEALVRWISPELGFVSPAEFIPIAEQSGKVGNLTKWVIQTVCKELDSLLAKHKNAVTVSINLSAMDTKNDRLFGEIEALFTMYEIDPKLIEFEVTESAYLENFDAASELFNSLQNMGCSIALDDFGTGYSSLAYLTQIDLDTLKIDKQFIDNMMLSERNELLISAIIDMALRLKLVVCAEGVETLEQANMLTNKGCQLLQGFYFAKPIPLDKIEGDI